MIRKPNEIFTILFLSVDIIGSTIYKSKTLDGNWAQFFKDFYEDFPSKFKSKYDNSIYNLNEKEKPILWKAIGDELIFTSEIEDPRKIHIILNCFVDVIKRYRKEIKVKNEDLNLKGTAWTASFPVVNLSVNIIGKEDYIGPSIDTGFRITKFSTNEKMAISVELAYIIAKTVSLETENSSINKIFYEGDEILKGVLNETAYPKFYLKIDNIDNPKRKKYLATKNSILNVNNDIIVKMIEHFIKSVNNENVMAKPYFPNSTSKDFNKMPNMHKERIKQLPMIDNYGNTPENKSSKRNKIPNSPPKI